MRTHCRRRVLVAIALGALEVPALFAAKQVLASGPKFEAVLSKRFENRKPVEPTNKFSRDTAVIHGYWQSEALDPKGFIKTAWIAVDVGDAAPPNTKIQQKTVAIADDPNAHQMKSWNGSFSLSKPTKGWPVGKYKAELYYNDQLVRTLPFTIE